MPDAVDRINQAVDQPHAGEHLDTYFHEKENSIRGGDGVVGV